MRLTVVGCSGSMSGPHSPASCYLVQADDADGRTWSVILDLGPGAFGQLMNVLDPRTLDAVLVSHLHPDHMADLSSLQVYLKYHPEGAVGPVRLVGPEGTSERIAAVCWLDPPEGVVGEFDVETYVPGASLQVGPLSIEPFAMRHPVPAFGVRITGPSVAGGHAAPRRATLAYTGDTDSCDGAADLARGVDLLVAEASFQEGREDVRGIHLTGRRAGELATGRGGDDAVGRLVLTHLPPWTDPAVVSAEARVRYDGPVDVARSGAFWDL
jgi:ribonuclease BN (tRNA processing enzyme)